MTRPLTSVSPRPGINPRRLPAQVLARLMRSYVADNDRACWLWTGRRITSGYGQFTVMSNGRERREQAHRVVYRLFVGPIPDGLVLDHLCRVPPCVNPRHLEPVTQRVNVLRGFGRGALHARRTHCPIGHPYDSVNTHITSDGWRRCRACEGIRVVRRRIERAIARTRVAS